VQEFVGNDGIVHSHASFVENTHDGLFLLKGAREFSARFLACIGNLEVRQAADMGRVVFDLARLKPLLKALSEKRIVKVLTP
jgi:hypothetical protein